MGDAHPEYVGARQFDTRVVIIAAPVVHLPYPCGGWESDRRGQTQQRPNRYHHRRGTYRRAPKRHGTTHRIANVTRDVGG